MAGNNCKRWNETSPFEEEWPRVASYQGNWKKKKKKKKKKKGERETGGF
jgi:hypothetical protein